MKRSLSVAVGLFCSFSICLSVNNLHTAAIVKPDTRLQASHHRDASAGAVRFLAGKALRSNANGKFRVVVYSSDLQEAMKTGVMPRTVTNDFFTAEVTADQLARLSKLGSVSRVLPAKKCWPLLDLSVPAIHADQLHSGAFNGTHYTGKNVILGFVDTGIDWTHLDFRSTTDQTKSRILWLWDQLDSTGSHPSTFNYGAEYNRTQISNELGSTPPHIVKEIDDEGHGTHVAGIAAGNGSSSGSGYIGVAPEADIIFVKTTFYDTDIIDGIAYIAQKAAAAGEPFVINLSLGSQQGAHDGTDPMEADIDEVVSTPGSAVVVAAGNDGNNPIHADTTLSQGGVFNCTFTIPAYTPASDVQNDIVSFDMWYGGGDKLTVSVTSPDGSVVSAASSDSSAIDTPTGDGAVQIFNATGGVNPLDSSKECTIDLFDYVANKPPKAGTWKITVTGASVGQGGGTFDIWLYDATITGTDGSSPEFATGNTYRKLVGVPGTSKKAITVGSYITRYIWNSIDGHSYNFRNEKKDRTGNYSPFSSIGPTRDGRQKPDVSAPGEVIASALSKDSFADSALIVPDGKHVVMEGTSMATPHVAGLAALLLQARPSLTSDQLKNAMISSAIRDSLTGSTPNSRWGYGKVNATGSMGSVLSVRQVSNEVPGNFSLDQNYPNPFNPSTQIRYTLPQNFKGNVSLVIFDVLGKRVATLVEGEQSAGQFSATWDASNSASGVYFCILRAGGFLNVKKMVLMK